MVSLGNSRDDFLFLGTRHRFYLSFSNKSFGTCEALLLIQERNRQAGPSVHCTPAFAVLLEPSLYVFYDPSVEGSISAAENIDRPFFSSPFLHPPDHSQVFSLHVR